MRGDKKKTINFKRTNISKEKGLVAENEESQHFLSIQELKELKSK